jgi:nucleoside-diphosphate-sugar epimerase
MNILVTGGAGFLGQRLVRRLLAGGPLRDRQGQIRPIERLVVTDVVPPPDFGDPRVRTVVGDFADPALLDRLVDPDTRSVFHLAAVVSAQAEADFDLGMRVNVDALRRLLERLRALGRVPKVLFTSSVAVYGGPLPEVVQDTTALCPQSSYGAEKAIGELLVNDFSRRGFIDGRVLRLPTISVRPGKPNKAASSFASGIIREPLDGQPSVCPVAPDLRLWLLSPRRAVEALVVGHDLPAEIFQGSRTVNLPGLSVTVAEMLAALARVAGAGTAARVSFAPDPAIERIVASWPGAWNTALALAMGFEADPDFDTMIRSYLDQERNRA